jgi:L-threonylcarbamoyladenylate synthase
MALIGTDLEKAISLLNADRLVSIPTETVYGLAGNALSEKAVLKIYEAKERPRFNPLIIHVSHIDRLKGLVAEIPETAKVIIEKFWPGPLTLLLPKTDLVPDIITAGSPYVAVRIPKHPLTLALLEKLDYPLAAPSANPSGYVSPTTAQHVQDQLGEKIEYILNGGTCEVGIESTIIGFPTEKDVRVYRLGGIALEDLQAYVQGELMVNTKAVQNTDAPGMLESHYAPTVKLIIGEPNNLNYEGIGALRFSTYHPEIRRDKQIILSKNGSLKEAALNLFASLRLLDTLGVNAVYGEYVPDYGLGKAINDRLRRASF